MKMKLLLLMGLVLILSTGAIFAATPSEIISDLTGLTQAELIEQHKAGASLHSIAESKGVLEEFKAALLKEKISRINQLVSDGKLTQEKADAMITAISENQNCDPANPQRTLKGLGMRLGNKDGLGQGCGDQGFGKRNNMRFGRTNN